MPKPVSTPVTWRPGFCGKIPSRGDFVRFGLPNGFVEPWEEWLRAGLVASRAAMGEDWLAAWLEAPVWRFALAPGVAGADTAVGVWMPSVDRVGRYFPLTLAATAEAAPTEALREAGGFLVAAQRAGRDALAADLTPEQLAERLDAATDAPAAQATACADGWSGCGSLWWTEGSPRRPAQAFAAAAGLPQADALANMIDARRPPPP